MYPNDLRFNVTKWTTTNTPGVSAAGTMDRPAGRLGHVVVDPPTGRQFKFVKISTSSVACYRGTPLFFVNVAQNVVTPDYSDSSTGLTSGAMFAGIFVCSTTLAAAKSTGYAWIMQKGPLGAQAGGLLGTYAAVIRVAASTDSGGICAVTDNAFARYSATKSAATKFHGVLVGKATKGASTAVSAGHIRSPWA